MMHLRLDVVSFTFIYLFPLRWSYSYNHTSGGIWQRSWPSRLRLPVSDWWAKRSQSKVECNFVSVDARQPTRTEPTALFQLRHSALSAHKMFCDITCVALTGTRAEICVFSRGFFFNSIFRCWEQVTSFLKQPAADVLFQRWDSPLINHNYLEIDVVSHINVPCTVIIFVTFEDFGCSHELCKRNSCSAPEGRRIAVKQGAGFSS